MSNEFSKIWSLNLFYDQVIHRDDSYFRSSVGIKINANDLKLTLMIIISSIPVTHKSLPTAWGLSLKNHKETRFSKTAPKSRIFINFQFNLNYLIEKFKGDMRDFQNLIEYFKISTWFFDRKIDKQIFHLRINRTNKSRK